MISSDNSTRRGSEGLTSAGPGASFTFHCMPCNGRFHSMVGAGRRSWRGLRMTLFCPACNAKWHERQAAKAAA